MDSDLSGIGAEPSSCSGTCFTDSNKAPCTKGRSHGNRLQKEPTHLLEPMGHQLPDNSAWP